MPAAGAVTRKKPKKSMQPKWKFRANLGDADPIDHGGYFVFEDETGVYPPEAELLISPDSDEAPEGWIVYRFILEPCTFIDGILSDNKFHPDHPAWFADKLSDVASSIGQPLEVIRQWIVSGSLEERALAWQAIGQYHGFDNLDSYPLTFKTRAEVETRYSDEIKGAKTA